MQKIEPQLELMTQVDRCTFYIHEPEDREGWGVVFQRPGGEPTVFIENITHFTTIAQMVAEGLRRLKAMGDESLAVIDHSGEWERWMTFSANGIPKFRVGIPTHYIR